MNNTIESYFGGSYIYARIRPHDADIDRITNNDSNNQNENCIYRASSYNNISEFECLNVKSTDNRVIEVNQSDNKNEYSIINFELHGSVNKNIDSIYNYQNIGQSLIEKSLRENGTATFIAYGQTGSGKTFSSVDIIYNTGIDLLKKSVSIRLSLYELKSEKCFDLLRSNLETDNSDNRQTNNISIVEDSNGKIHINTSIVDVNDENHLIGLLNTSLARRTTKSTTANSSSSRSHCFCCYHIKETNGQILIVDLAGNERTEDALNHDLERIQEMKSINLSLSCLKDCIRLKINNNNNNSITHVPYRRSKLTLILRDYLFEKQNSNLNSLCYFIIHLNPTRSNLKHSLNSLYYATSMIKEEMLTIENNRLHGVLKWSPEQVQHWISELENGKYFFLFEHFHISGKLLSVEWIGHLERRVVAAGGSEQDANYIYDRFHSMIKAEKKNNNTNSTYNINNRKKIYQSCLQFASRFNKEDVVVKTKEVNKET